MGLGSGKFQAEMAEQFLKLTQKAVGEDTNAEFVLRHAVRQLDPDELDDEHRQYYDTAVERLNELAE